MNFEELIDQDITVKGVAFDDHSGAVVVTDDDSAIYIGGLPYWSKQDRGQRVEVTGTLRYEKLAPDPTVDTDGVVSHGMFGSQLVLEGATWRILPNA